MPFIAFQTVTLFIAISLGGLLLFTVLWGMLQKRREKEWLAYGKQLELEHKTKSDNVVPMTTASAERSPQTSA